MSDRYELLNKISGKISQEVGAMIFDRTDGLSSEDAFKVTCDTLSTLFAAMTSVLLTAEAGLERKLKLMQIIKESAMRKLIDCETGDYKGMKQ